MGAAAGGHDGFETRMSGPLLTLFILAFAMIAAWWGLLRLMDLVADIDFKKTISAISREPLPAAVYFGARALAVALICAEAFGRFV